MKLNDIHIGESPLTGNIYIGTVSKRDPLLWNQKRNITSQFIGAFLGWTPPGTTRTVRSSDGAEYEIEVRQTKPAVEKQG